MLKPARNAVSTAGWHSFCRLGACEALQAGAQNLKRKFFYWLIIAYYKKNFKEKIFHVKAI
ncbi:hypothetical protein KKA09_02360 [Patescibacteria group bacterium]|nr:hypothetical protein [Patescibacteria group bacterium]